MNKLSVVILNYNGKKYLEKFLPGVVSYSQPYEVVLADNGSTDGSVSFVREQLPEVRILIFEENHGFCGGYNKAIEQIESEYIVLLNSDVEVAKGWIAPVLNMMERRPEMAAAQPKILDWKNPKMFEYAGAAGGYIDSLAFPFCRGRIFHSIEKDEQQYNDSREVFWASGSCLFVRRSVYLEAGGLDNDFFAHMEEIDLCWRLWNMGYTVGVCPESQVFHVGGGTLDKNQPRKTYLNFRNGLGLMVKNEAFFKLLWKLPLRMMLDWLAAMHFAFNNGTKHAGAILKAHFHFLPNFARHYKKRKLIKGTSKNPYLSFEASFSPDTSLAKYSFNAAKLRFCCLVSEKNLRFKFSKWVFRSALKRKTKKNPRYRGLIVWRYFGAGQKRFSQIVD